MALRPIVHRPPVDNDLIADIWIEVALARIAHGEEESGHQAVWNAHTLREPLREAEGLREHNLLALRRGNW